MVKAISPVTVSRLAALDVLRALAVFLVLGRHMPELSVGPRPARSSRFFMPGRREDGSGWISFSSSADF